MNKISDYFSEELNRYKFSALLVFCFVITLLAWQSDDSYHAYIMAKNLVEGNGFVYNIGQRATASTCPLYTLVVAAGYFVIRDMFFVSLLINIMFSASAFKILIWDYCKTKKQIIFSTLILIGSVSFVSYTTSGLENSMLFFLGACFMKLYLSHEYYDGREMLLLALTVSLIAMTRMDTVLIFVPMALYVYLFRRDGVSFVKAVGLGVLGLLPFVLWELFSTFYYGFPFPNTAYAKLGTDFPLSDYIIRGIKYYLNAAVCDPILLVVILFAFLAAVSVKKPQYIICMSGPVIYGLYLIYIGGDFMMGRHFTLMFFISLICYMDIKNREFSELGKGASFHRYFVGFASAALIFTCTSHVISDQFLFGGAIGSPVSDERAGYFTTASLFNNVYSLVTTGELCIQNTWNDEGVEELRDNNMTGGILTSVPGITKYYNNDLYLNDLYALGDPYLAHLPAVKESGWRIGHMWREAPVGYMNLVRYNWGTGAIKNDDARMYYEIIDRITRAPLFDKERIKAVIDINLGRYDYLVEGYKSSLDENGRIIEDENGTDDSIAGFYGPW
ncbi:MAG: hypothetical protein K6E49_02040 [Lachnospiraceae bacterium]|nr:hypothetical protein [Lachnospiraceae bacterium]